MSDRSAIGLKGRLVMKFETEISQWELGDEMEEKGKKRERVGFGMEFENGEGIEKEGKGDRLNNEGVRDSEV
jgi:hypothetical protein